jgi:hypothetical protein
MTSIFANSANLNRGKGNKKTRLGPRGATLKEKEGKQYTPNELATQKLLRILTFYPEFTEDERKNIQEEMRGLEQIRFMNMEVLGATLAYLKSVRGNLTKENFTNELLKPFLRRLTPKPEDIENGKLSGTDLQTIEIKMKASIYRYAIAVITFRERTRQELLDLAVAEV